MNDSIELKTAAVPFGLELRPERAVNGATAWSEDAAPTEVQALILSSGRDAKVLVGADLIWFGSEQADVLRTQIAAAMNCPVESVVLCASHTHGTPNPEPKFAYGETSAELVQAIRDKVLAAVDAAVKSPVRRVRLVRGQALVAGIALNRRREAWLRRGWRLERRVQNLPNRSRPVGERVTVLGFIAEDTGAPIAVAVHFSCHAVADSARRRGADFPGVLRDALRARLAAQPVCIFLQGFCGDIRPALLRRPHGLRDRALRCLIGERFRPSEDPDSAAIGKALADGAMEALNTARPVKSVPPSSLRHRLALNDVDGRPTGRDLDVTIWQWPDDLRLVFASAEMLSGLAPAQADTIAVGYANGMAGYIAPAEDHPGGGYEIDGFLARFGLTKRFDPGIGAAFRRLAAGAL